MRGISRKWINFGHTVNISCTILVSSYISYFLIWQPVASFLPLTTAIVLFLKLISFACVNDDLWNQALLLKEAKKNDGEVEGQVLYPHNLSMNGYVYFLLAPTLCYQTSYPITEQKPRPLFILKRLNEVVLSLAGMYFLAMQYAVPVLESCITAMDESRYLFLLERTLKLSVVSVVIWLLMFWCIFHSWLNVLGELLQFGDRMFYKPWWNAKDISEYWRLWNAPVHNWCKRHVYRPLIANNVSPMTAVICVFTVSALLHEVLVGIPTHNLSGLAFFGMMAQIPLILLTHVVNRVRSKYFDEGLDHIFDTIGNFIFWASFTVLGQPTCIVLYYYMWNKSSGNKI
jgi:diacylglycerol O-acyltransferase-1